MLARVVTLRFDPVREAFDDTPLQEFLKRNEVFAIRDHFFVGNEVPCLALLVTCEVDAAAHRRIPACQRR